MEERGCVLRSAATRNQPQQARSRQCAQPFGRAAAGSAACGTQPRSAQGTASRTHF